MKEIRKPLDIADVKAGINAGRLFVQIKDGLLMLGDYQTGEVVRLSDIELKPVIHAKFGFVGPDLSVYRYDTRYGSCSSCKKRIVFVINQTRYCPNCGARMDGDPHDSGQ